MDQEGHRDRHQGIKEIKNVVFYLLNKPNTWSSAGFRRDSKIIANKDLPVFPAQNRLIKGISTVTQFKITKTKDLRHGMIEQMGT